MANLETYPKLIKTDPLGEDHFTGGSQNRIATAIASNINEETFKLIGIDGLWGSGKSNVIKILSNKLTKTHHFFVYDAWSHQEDLQRRSFLEELTEDLTNNHIIDAKTWNKELKNLLAKEKTVTSKVVPRLSIALLITLIVATLIPVTKAIADSLKDDQLQLKIGISIIPFGAAIVAYVIAGFLTGKWNIQDLFAIYKEKETEQTMNEVISESEPSAAKFRNWMHQLAGALNKKRLVIVFDNMDRLPNDKVQNLWSNIHTFFSEDKKYQKISVIVPFDREHLGNAFGGKPKVEGEPHEAGNAPYFIKKTFPVVFTVPPASLTDWRNFFRVKYKEAFGNLIGCENVATIYEIYNQSMTPRDVITFINDIVGLKLIWLDEIEIKYLALFAATKHDRFNNPNYDILRGVYAEPANTIFRGDESLTDTIAALYFNISPEKAGEITMRRAIEDALREKQANRLLTYSKLPDFYTILNHIINKSNVNLELFAFTLNETEKLANDEQFNEKLEEIWNHLIGIKMGLRIDAENEFTPTDEILLLHATKGKRLAKLAKCIGKVLAESRNSNGRTYATALTSFKAFIQKNNLRIDFSSTIQERHLDADQYILFAEVVGEDIDQYSVYTQDEDLQNRLIQKLPASLKEVYIGSYLRKFKMPLLKRRIEELISSPSVGENIEPVYRLYKQIAEPPLRMPESSSVAIWLNGADMNSLSYYELGAMRIMMGLDITASGHSLLLLSTEDEDDIKELAIRVLYYGGMDELLWLTFKMGEPIYPLLVKKIIKDDLYKRESFDFTRVMPRIERIVEILNISYEDLLAYLDRWSELLPSQVNSQNFNQVFEEISFIEKLIINQGLLADATLKLAFKYIQELQLDDWSDLYSSQEIYQCKLLKVLLKSEVVSILSKTGTDVLGEVLVNLTNAESDDEEFEYTEDFNLFYQKSNKEQLTNTINSVREKLIEQEEIDSKKFLMFEPMLRDQGELLGNARKVVKFILSKVLNDSDTLNRIIEQKEFYLPIFKRASQDSFLAIRALRSFIENNETEPRIDEYAQLLKEISQMFFGEIIIVSASYYSSMDNDLREDVTASLARMSKEGLLYHKKVDNSIASQDPHQGIVKVLFLHYYYNNETHQKNINEGNWISIPEI